MSNPSPSTFDFALFQSTFIKKFGKESLTDLTQQPKKGEPGTFVPTPSESLNLALGIGGLPFGRVIEIFGPESSGKSTLALEALKQVQIALPDRPVGYIDAEQAISLEYAEAIGLDLSPGRFVFTQEMETQRALEMAKDMISAGFGAVVIDSVASLIPKAQLEEGDSTDPKMGGNSKFFSTHLPFVIGAAQRTGCIPIYLNQVREKLGVMFGNPETTPGGRALPFYASIRIRTQILEQIKGKETGAPIGARIRAKVIKNKVAPPFRIAEYDLIYGKGIDSLGDLVDESVRLGILPKSGAWYKIDGKNVAQGREQMKEYLESNPKIKKSLLDTLWANN